MRPNNHSAMNLRIHSTILRPILGLFVACAAVVAPGLARAGDEAAKPIETTVGAEFAIELKSNPTTGYQWQVQKLDEAMVKAIGSSYHSDPQPKKNGEPMVGVGGKEIWKFKALKAGETTIEMKYVRPWEKDTPPVQTATFRVVIKQAAGAAPAPANEPAAAPAIKDGAEVVLTGKLEGGIMAIGGESTGWRLEYLSPAGKQSIEVDCSALKDVPEGPVRVSGKVVTKDYVERGPTLVLKATAVKAEK